MDTFQENAIEEAKIIFREVFRDADEEIVRSFAEAAAYFAGAVNDP